MNNYPKFSIGMSADMTLAIMQATRNNHVRPPKKIGKDKNGYIVKWFVKGATLTLKRKKKKDCYRISEIDLHK